MPTLAASCYLLAARRIQASSKTAYRVYFPPSRKPPHEAAMQSYDLLMLLILVGLTLFGYYKGMAWQIAYLASFVASYFVAVQFADRFAPVFGQTAPWNKLLAMAAIYIATSFAIWMLFRAVRNAIDKIKLRSFDRQMGAFIGFARGVVWCLGITFVALTFVARYVPSVQQHIIDSKSGVYIAQFIDQCSALPPEVHQVIGPYLQQINQGLEGGQATPYNFGSQPPSIAGQPATTPAQSAGGFLNGLSGQVSQQVTQFQNQLQNQVQNGLQTGLQNQIQNGVDSTLRSAGLSGNPQPAGVPAIPASTGLPAWPQSPSNVAPAATAPPPATNNDWPVPPAGTGWPGR